MTQTAVNSITQAGDASDPRPRVWIGHVSLGALNFKRSLAFFEFIGMRQVALRPGLAVLELRGGTHLVLTTDMARRSQRASFDLMVDDLEAQHSSLMKAGYAPTPIESGKIHRNFQVTEPSGHVITFNDSHVVGVV